MRLINSRLLACNFQQLKGQFVFQVGEMKDVPSQIGRGDDRNSEHDPEVRAAGVVARAGQAVDTLRDPFREMDIDEAVSHMRRVLDVAYRQTKLSRLGLEIWKKFREKTPDPAVRRFIESDYSHTDHLVALMEDADPWGTAKVEDLTRLVTVLGSAAKASRFLIEAQRGGGGKDNIKYNSIWWKEIMLAANTDPIELLGFARGLRQSARSYETAISETKELRGRAVEAGIDGKEFGQWISHVAPSLVRAGLKVPEIASFKIQVPTVTASQAAEFLIAVQAQKIALADALDLYKTCNDHTKAMALLDLVARGYTVAQLTNISKRANAMSTGQLVVYLSDVTPSSALQILEDDQKEPEFTTLLAKLEEVKFSLGRDAIMAILQINEVKPGTVTPQRLAFLKRQKFDSSAIIACMQLPNFDWDKLDIAAQSPAYARLVRPEYGALHIADLLAMDPSDVGTAFIGLNDLPVTQELGDCFLLAAIVNIGKDAATVLPRKMQELRAFVDVPVSDVELAQIVVRMSDYDMGKLGEFLRVFMLYQPQFVSALGGFDITDLFYIHKLGLELTALQTFELCQQLQRLGFSPQQIATLARNRIISGYAQRGTFKPSLRVLVADVEAYTQQHPDQASDQVVDSLEQTIGALTVHADYLKMDEIGMGGEAPDAYRVALTADPTIGAAVEKNPNIVNESWRVDASFHNILVLTSLLRRSGLAIAFPDVVRLMRQYGSALGTCTVIGALNVCGLNPVEVSFLLEATVDRKIDLVSLEEYMDSFREEDLKMWREIYPELVVFGFLTGQRNNPGFPSDYHLFRIRMDRLSGLSPAELVQLYTAGTPVEIRSFLDEIITFNSRGEVKLDGSAIVQLAVVPESRLKVVLDRTYTTPKELAEAVRTARMQSLDGEVVARAN